MQVVVEQLHLLVPVMLMTSETCDSVTRLNCTVMLTVFTVEDCKQGKVREKSVVREGGREGGRGREGGGKEEGRGGVGEREGEGGKEGRGREEGRKGGERGSGGEGGGEGGKEETFNGHIKL